MHRRNFMGLVAGSAALAAEGAPAMASAPEAGSAAAWQGGAVLQGGKGYVATPLGQMHYRVLGEGAVTPVLLIHQTPMGIVEFAGVQPALAALGRRSVTSDNPGYGLSDHPPGPLTVQGLADNLIPLLDQLKIDKAVVAGHHTGAAFAAAFAARHPDRTAAVVMHGCPLYTPEERAERLARPLPDVTLKADGSHLSDAFTHTLGSIGATPQNMAGATWATIGVFMAGPKSPTYKAVFANDMTADVMAIKAPALVVSDGADSLAANDRRVAAMRPDFATLTFSPAKSFALMAEPERWAKMVDDFAKMHGA